MSWQCSVQVPVCRYLKNFDQHRYVSILHVFHHLVVNHKREARGETFAGISAEHV